MQQDEPLRRCRMPRWINLIGSLVRRLGARGVVAGALVSILVTGSLLTVAIGSPRYVATSPITGSLARGGTPAHSGGPFYLETNAGRLAVTPADGARLASLPAPLETSVSSTRIGIATSARTAWGPLSTSWRVVLSDDQSLIRLGQGGVGIVAHRAPAGGPVPQIGPNEYLVATASGPLVTDAGGQPIHSQLEISGSKVTLVARGSPGATALGAQVLWSPTGALRGGWWSYGVDQAFPHATFALEQGTRQHDGSCSYREQSVMKSNTQGAGQQVAELPSACTSLVYDTTSSLDPSSNRSTSQRPLASASALPRNVAHHKEIQRDPADIDVNWIDDFVDWRWTQRCVESPQVTAHYHYAFHGTGWGETQDIESDNTNRCQAIVASTFAQFKGGQYFPACLGSKAVTDYDNNIIEGFPGGRAQPFVHHTVGGAPCYHLLHFAHCQYNKRLPAGVSAPQDRRCPGKPN